MSNEKNVVRKVVEDMKDHAAMQHEITKERHKAVKVTPADAKEMFHTQYEYAKLSPAEKQRIELAELQAKNNSNN